MAVVAALHKRPFALRQSAAVRRYGARLAAIALGLLVWGMLGLATAPTAFAQSFGRPGPATSLFSFQTATTLTAVFASTSEAKAVNRDTPP